MNQRIPESTKSGQEREGEREEGQARITAEVLLHRWNAEFGVEERKEKERRWLYLMSWISIAGSAAISLADLPLGGYLLPFTVAAAVCSWMGYAGVRIFPRTLQEDLPGFSDDSETVDLFREAQEKDRLIDVVALTLGIVFMGWIL